MKSLQRIQILKYEMLIFKLYVSKTSENSGNNNCCLQISEKLYCIVYIVLVSYKKVDWRVTGMGTEPGQGRPSARSRGAYWFPTRLDGWAGPTEHYTLPLSPSPSLPLPCYLFTAEPSLRLHPQSLYPIPLLPLRHVQSVRALLE